MEHPLSQKTPVLDGASLGRVLIVEDNEGNAFVTKTLLELIGCSYDIARSGEEAVHYVMQRQYPIILMDIVLKGAMNGLETITFIRKHERTSQHVPAHIIAITGKTREELNLTADHGINSFIYKPFQPEELFRKLSLTCANVHKNV